MTQAKLKINEFEENRIKNALDVEDLKDLNVNITEKKKTGFLGAYSIVFHESISNLSKMNLKPNAYKICLYLFSQLSMGNIILNFSQKQIAEDLGLYPSNVSRAFKELFKHKILIQHEKNGHVYLNSNVATMGIPKNFNKNTMDNLQKSQVETEDFTQKINLFKSSNSTKIQNKEEKSKFDDDKILNFPDDNTPF